AILLMIVARFKIRTGAGTRPSAVWIAGAIFQTAGQWPRCATTARRCAHRRRGIAIPECDARPGWSRIKRLVVVQRPRWQWRPGDLDLDRLGWVRVELLLR